MTGAVVLVAAEAAVWYGSALRHPRLLRWHLGGWSRKGPWHTDAGWSRPATKPLHPTGHAHAWYWMSFRRRSAIRNGGFWAFLAIQYGLLTALVATLALLAATALTAAAWGAWRGVLAVRHWKHNRDWVQPLNDTLPPAVTVRELAPDRSRTVLALAPGTIADDKFKQLIMLTAAAKLNLPLADLTGDWSKLHGKKPEAVITRIEPPPGYVSFADILPLAEAAAEHEVVLGLGRRAAPGVVSVDNDSPHIGLSMGSGDGKSVTARNAASQLAHHGALIAVLDTKLMSQHWAAGLRNVAYARTPEEIHELAIWLSGEVDRRNDVALYHADVEGKVHAKVGPRIIGILEEMNATQAVLTAYWKSEGGKGRSPAVAALDHVSNTGRQVGLNLFYIGQRLSAKAVSGGSGDARENLGVLLMSNPAASTWKMLVGDRHALPAATDVQGRLQVVTAKKVLEIQGAYVTGAQARDYATSGIVAVPRHDMPCVGGLAPVGTPERAAQDVPDIPAIEGNGPDLRIVPDSPRPPPRITIREALEENISGPTYEAVRKALSRDLARGLPVPKPVGSRGNADEYDRVEWCDWEELRRQPKRKAVR